MISELEKNLRWVIRFAFHWQTLLPVTTVSIITALAGPFQTDDVAPFSYLFFGWMLTNFAVTFAIYLWFGALASFKKPIESFQFNLIFFPIGAIIGGTVAQGLLDLSLYPPATKEPVWHELVFFVALIMALTYSMRVMFMSRGAWAEAQLSDRSVEPAFELAPARVMLAERLHLSPTEQILKIAADGHYTEITTSEGTHRIRLRFSDALLEVEGLDGVMTHRSFWVAADAITSWDGDMSKPSVYLSDGSAVPVSKTYRPALEAMGLPYVEGDENPAKAL